VFRSQDIRDDGFEMLGKGLKRLAALEKLTFEWSSYFLKKTQE